MRKLLVVGAHRVLKRVLARAAADAHLDAREVVAEGDLRARVEVLAVAHRRGEAAADVLYRGDGDHVAHEVRLVRDVALGAVEERVEALIGSEFRRHARHQLGVDDRDDGEEFFADDAGFLVRLGVRDDAARVRLRARARRRRYRDYRQRVVLRRFASARAALHVVPEVAAVGCHQRDGLRGVHYAAAAERDDEVAAALAREGSARHDGRLQRVRLDLVEDEIFDARLRELLLRAREIAVLARGLPVRYDEHRPAPGQRLLVHVVQLARAEKRLRRYVHQKFIHLYIALLSGYFPLFISTL